MDLEALPRRTGTAQVLAISGSLRAASSNTRLLEITAVLARERMSIHLFPDLATLPPFNPDLDRELERPAPVLRLRELIAGADALLISSPEYAHGVPGSLKNALDWLVSGPEFPALPVGLLAPSAYGTHAAAALREILTTMSAELPPALSLTLPLAGRSSALPDLLADPEVSGPIGRLLEALAHEIARARAAHRRLVAPGPRWPPASLTTTD